VPPNFKQRDTLRCLIERGLVRYTINCASVVPTNYGHTARERSGELGLPPGRACARCVQLKDERLKDGRLVRLGDEVYWLCTRHWQWIWALDRMPEHPPTINYYPPEARWHLTGVGSWTIIHKIPIDHRAGEHCE
jgi:hypothetical protein